MLLNLHVCLLVVAEPESQFPHRKVVVKRARDVRAQYDLLDEIGR